MEDFDTHLKLLVPRPQVLIIFILLLQKPIPSKRLTIYDSIWV